MFVFLVNNVGYIHEYPVYFGEVPEEVSCAPVCQQTALWNSLHILVAVIWLVVFVSIVAQQDCSDQLPHSSTDEVCVV